MPTPGRGYYQVLHDPFGIDVLMKNEKYPTPNRFFAHWTASTYFMNMPLFLQKFTNPVSSVYLSTAIAKIIIQILIIYMLAVYISNTRSIFKLDFLIPAILITPLFQAWGYNRYMGIIDQSVIYTFFYALPMGLLLLLFLPFFRAIYYDKSPQINIFKGILIALFMVVLSLNGPLVPGVVLTLCPLVLLNVWLKKYKQTDITPSLKRILVSLKKIPNFLLFYFTGFMLLCLYSLYLGMNDGLNPGDSFSLIDRYLSLPQGLYNVISKKLGFPLLFLMIIINVIVIRRHYQSEEAGKILNLLKWICIFAILYTLLLPLGGYRTYRPNIVRYDTIMPVTLGLFFVFGYTTHYLIKNISNKYRAIYIMGVIIFSLIFTNADRVDLRNYECERLALEMLARSGDKTVILDSDCPVMEWNIFHDPGQSELNAGLFYHWNITTEKKLYYQKK